MSMLERLNIRGIRNFGVDAEDEQVNYLSMWNFFSNFLIH